LLRSAAELVGEVMVMGKTKYLEVWEAEKFRTSRLLAEPYTDEDAKVIAQFGI
jgi:DNA-binding transcriptional regulator/RsmH inhibitor MraZ